MKLQLILTVLILLLPSGFSCPQGGKNDSVTQEEYAVYSDLLNEIKKNPNDGKEVKLLIINDQTEGPMKMCLPDEISKWEKEIKADELKPLLDDLLAKNTKNYALGKQFNLTRNYVLLNVKDFSDIFKNKEDGWEDFYKKYANSSGYITYSRVGFNSTLTRAIIYRETSCGSLCGYGGYLLLNKENEKWKVATGFGCWQS